MKKAVFQRIVCFVLTVATLMTGLGFTVSAGELKNPDGTNDIYTDLEDMQALISTSSYEKYLAEYAQELSKQSGYIFPDGNGGFTNEWKIDVIETMQNTGNGLVVGEWSSLADDSKYKSDLKILAESKDFVGKGNSVYLPADGFVTWEFTVSEEQAGLYYIRWDYYTCNTSESSISAIERQLKINDKVPFNEASSLTFTKFWQYKNIETETVPADADDEIGTTVEYTNPKKDKEPYRKIVTTVEMVDGVKTKTVTTYTIDNDINGNSMAPEIEQLPQWGSYYCQDTTGYEQDYFLFYVNEGSFRITLAAEREPLVIGGLTLERYDKDRDSIKSYSQYLADHPGATDATEGDIIHIQAEFPDAVSDAAVVATNDNTSAETEPVWSKAQLYNVIGENSYNTVGQWAAYKFRVTKTGYYNLSMRYLQKALEGMYVCRGIKLSGGEYGATPSLPFKEAYNTQFNYSKDWQSTYLSAAADSTTGYDGSAFKFYFEEGVEYTLYLECSLGSLKELIQRVEVSLNKMNDCYLRILQLTGADPDIYRDYNFMRVMPDVLQTFLEEAVELMNIKHELEDLCGGTTGAHTATLETVALLLDKMGRDKGEQVAANMSSLKSYLGTLGTWINDSKSSTLMVDSISVVPADEGDDGLKKAEANFFKSLWFEITSFIYSFFTDYDAMGLKTEPDENTKTVDVWLAYGRDQSQIWRTMIDANNGYTNSTGNAAALKLVTGGTLLPSILSGKGPDVYIGLGSSDVINYAIRDAVMGISGNVGLDKDSDAYKYNHVFNERWYTYYDHSTEKYTETQTPLEGFTENSEVGTKVGTVELKFITKPFDEYINPFSATGNKEVDDLAYKNANFSQAAMDTITLLGVSYGVPQTMGFAMMFYRMDVLAKLGQEIPESWSELLAILPVLQTNNMSIGVAYISALDFMIYQKGGSFWKYTDPEVYDSKYAGMQVDLDSDIALEAFDFTCRLYSDYSFPVSYDAANRFRTGEMPIIIGDYGSIYNTLVVYATEIHGLWEFCSLPGSEFKDEDGNDCFNYDSLAGVTATVMLHGCEDDPLAAWQFIQWQTGDEVQANYGNKIVALIGPSAKYETANLKALDNLSWTSSEKIAIKDQMMHLSSIVNYPGSYIIGRYLKFAFLDAVNAGADATDALRGYMGAINTEIERKRKEFDLVTTEDLKDMGLTEPPKLTDTTN